MGNLTEDVAAGGGLVVRTRWMTGASLTCHQAPRCFLVSHCHLCQQTMSCIQPAALMYIDLNCRLQLATFVKQDLVVSIVYECATEMYHHQRFN